MEWVFNAGADSSPPSYRRLSRRVGLAVELRPCQSCGVMQDFGALLGSPLGLARPDGVQAGVVGRDFMVVVAPRTPVRYDGGILSRPEDNRGLRFPELNQALWITRCWVPVLVV